MTLPPRYVPVEEYLDMAKHIQEAISALADATEGLRTVTLLVAAALARQKNIDTEKFLTDVSAMIDDHYSQDASIPIQVLDFRAELVRCLSSKA
jgi:hypothetical protein